jgi:hypothetical protein
MSAERDATKSWRASAHGRLPAGRGYGWSWARISPPLCAGVWKLT